MRRHESRSGTWSQSTVSSFPDAEGGQPAINSGLHPFDELACHLVVSNTVDMLVDINALRRHRAAIQMGDDGPFVWGDFERVVAESMVVREAGRPQHELYRHLRATQNRLTDLRTIPVKLDWMLQQRDAGNLDPYDWMFFASSDVNSFLSNVRSLFDHLSDALRAAAPKPGSIPQQSFRKLRDWVGKGGEREAEQLGRSAFSIVAGCDWFRRVLFRSDRKSTRLNSSHT